MKTIDLTPIKQNDDEYSALADQLSQKYQCDWDDQVHESYGKYVAEVHQYSDSIRNIRCKAETLEKELSMLQVEEMIRLGDSLCKEAASL